MDRTFYLLWDGFGPAALAVFSALMFGAALLPFALMIGRVGLQPWAEAIAIVFLAITLVPYTSARPHLVGPNMPPWAC
jgi:hypothetical protein